MLSACDQSGTTTSAGHLKINKVFTDSKDRALIIAATKGDVKKIDELIDQGANVNVVGKYGVTPLFWVLAQAKINYIGFEALLKHGANPNYIPPLNNEDLGGLSITYILADSPRIEALKLVLQYGGNPNIHNPNSNASGNNETALMAAAEDGSIENIKLLLKYGADLEGKDGDGMTPLLWTIFNNQFETAYFLLQQGANYKVISNLPGSTTDPRYQDKVMKIDISKEISFSLGVSLREGVSNEQEPWREKVIKWLEARGVPRPKPAPY